MKNIITVFLIMTLSPAAYAATFDVDPNYSTLGFRLKHLMGYAVGRFKDFQGKIELDEKNAALKRIEGTINVGSIDTALEARDQDLHDKIFDANQFPQATFKTKSVNKDNVTAELTIKGKTKTIHLDYVFLGTAHDQYGNLKTAVSLIGKINRKDFGLDYNLKTEDGSMLLGDDVELAIELHGIIKKK